MPSSRTVPAKKSGATVAVGKVDFKKLQPEMYKARREIGEIRCPKATYLAVDGAGEPGGAAFQEAIGKLFTLAYTTKFALKKAGKGDFAIPALECVWPEDCTSKPKAEWCWRLLLRVPASVTERALGRVRRTLVEKKAVNTDAVKRIAWTEGRALQVLHVGPYETVGESYQKLVQEAAARGMSCIGSGHEVYLNDPRRVGPEKTKTIVRLAVERPRAH